MSPGVTPILLGLIYITVGFISCFYGYKIFRIVLALVGFIIGFSIGMALAPADQQVVGLVIGLVGGVIGAVIFYALYFIGVFLAGVALGATLATVLAGVVNADGTFTVILLAVGAIIGGLLALLLNKLIIVLATAFSGSGGVVQGLTVLLPGVFGQSFLLSDGELVTDQNWLGLIVFIVLGIAGFIVQYMANREELRRTPRQSKTE